jgi:hypothetical protein
LLVRPNGQQGPLEGYTASGIRRFRLPAGILAGNGQSFVTFRYRAGRTAIARYQIARGARLARAWTIEGHFWPATVSADARWIALQQLSRRNTSWFGLFDSVRGRVVDRIELHGSYQAEAMSPNARRLFLIHWTQTTYDLRTFDFTTRKVRPTRLAEPDEKMTGTAATAVATRDGHWLLTLYAEGNGMGFVHALDLRTGIAHCVDLPWRAFDFNVYGTAALSLSPSQDKLYLANPLLGRVTVVDLRRVRVTRDVRFTPVATAALTYGIWPSAALTANGRMLAFSGGRNVWLYDTAYGTVRGPLAAADRAPARTGVQVNITALGFSGRRLVALKTDRTQALFDAGTAQRLDATGPAELFTVRSSFDLTSLVGYDANGGPRFVLPPGRSSADNTRYFSSALGRDGGGTSIERYSPGTGRRLSTHVIPGRWTLGAVSASGRTLAVARHARGTTLVRVLDADTADTLHARKLDGVYTLDAVTDDGNKLFLIQHYRRGNYAVRALDFARNRLWTATLREKGVAEQPLMTGRAAGQVASRDGTWLLTLYLNTKEHKAFVHALNLRAAYAVCIDLPAGGRSMGVLRDYSLTLAPGGDVYASNGALGVLARVDLRQQTVADLLHFASKQSDAGSWSASALSRNGRMLYFANGRSVWRYDTTRGTVRGPFFAPGPVLGFAFSRDGRKLFAARADGGVAAFDAERGTILRA